MQTTTALFKENLINGVTEPKLSIAGTDYGIDSLVTMKTSCHAMGDSKPTMGLAVSKEIDVVLYTQSDDIPRMAVLIPRVKTVAKNSTDSEWIQKGYFYTDTREEDTATGQISIHGYDSMLKAEVSYPSVTHVWPYGDVNVVNEIAAEMGIAVDAKTTALMTAGFNVPFPAQLTMREVLSNIAGLYGGCFVISDTNTLLLRCLWDVSGTAEVAARTAGWDKKPKCSSSTDIPALSACTGVRFLVDDGQEVMLGDETGYVFEINCPWATMENAVFLYNKLRGLVYRPYEMSGAMFNPAAEIGDSVLLGEGTVSGLWSYEQNFNSLCRADIAAPYEEEIDHEYPYISRSQRNYERKQRGVIASLNLLTDRLNSVVETVTSTVTESENIINFPLSDQNPYTYGGLTFTYLDDGGIHISGSYGESIPSYLYVPFTKPTHISESVPWLFMVETSSDFPINVLAVMYRSSSGIYGLMSTLAYIKSAEDKKTFYNTWTNEPSEEAYRNVIFGFLLRGESGLTEFNHTVYPQILLGDTVEDWVQPVGSRDSEIDALRSEITQTAEAITAYVEREVANVSSSGYNLLSLPYDNYKAGQTFTMNNVAITINTDGSITFNGTSSRLATPTLISYISKCKLPSGEYTIGFGTDDTSTGMAYTVGMAFVNSSGHINIAQDVPIKNDTTFTFSPNSSYPYLYLQLYFPSGVSFSNFTIYPQLEYGEKLHEWQPVALSAKTTVTETADGLEVEIAKKVGSDEVITKINASAEGITINTNKLNLTGVLTATDVGASGTTVINGSRISGGTITLGGVNNGNGVVRVLDASGNQVGLFNKDGIEATAGNIGGWSIDNGLIATKRIPTSYGGAYDNTINLSPEKCRVIISEKYAYGSNQTNYLDIGTAYEFGDPYLGLRIYSIVQDVRYDDVIIEYGAGLDIKFNEQIKFYDLKTAKDVLWYNSTNDRIIINNGIDVYIYGGLQVYGNKNRIIKTKSYGDRAISAYETAEPYFGDIGQGIIDENGECIVPIEEIFSETVDLDTEYQVFLQKEGPGDIWVHEKAKDHFTVKGTNGLKFAWELKAKQIDHGGKRLKEIPSAENPEA